MYSSLTIYKGFEFKIHIKKRKEKTRCKGSIVGLKLNILDKTNKRKTL
jgi:hypothetical protein